MTKLSLPLDKHQWHPSPLPGQVVLVTTVDEHGQPSVATKSWISMVAFGPPPVLMFGCNHGHSTARNVLKTGSFVVNVPCMDLIETAWAVGSDRVPPGRARFDVHGLTPIPSEKVDAPRVEECRAHLECELDGTRSWGEEVAIFGRVVAVSMDAAVMGGELGEQYASLAPFFFLEGRVAAGLSVPVWVGAEEAG